MYQGQFDLVLFLQTPTNSGVLGQIAELGFTAKRSGTFDWNNVQLDALIDAYQFANKQELQHHYLRQLDIFTAEHRPVIPLLKIPLLDGLSSTIKGYRRGYSGDIDFRGLTLA